MTAGRPGLLFGVSVLWLPLAFLFDGVTTLFLPLLVEGDAARLGLVSFIGLTVGALLQPIAGWASDRLWPRLDRRTFVALAATPAILGIWLMAGAGGLAAALAGYVLVQAAAAAVQAGAQALVPEHVGHDRQGRASGLRLGLDVGGAFIAFIVLGALLAGPGPEAAALAVTAVLLVAVVLMLALVPPTRHSVPSGARGSASPAARRPTEGRGGTWTLDLPPGLGRLIAGRFLFLFGTYSVGRFLLLLVAERLGSDPARVVDEAGGLLAVLSLATAIAAVAVGRLADRESRTRLMAAGALLSSTGIAVLAVPAGLPGLLGGGLLMSLGTATFVTANWAAATSAVPAADAGRLLGFVSLGTGLAAASAGLLGFAVEAAGFGPALLIAALVTAGAALSNRPARGWLRPAREAIP